MRTFTILKAARFLFASALCSMLFLSHGITAEKTVTLKLANQFAPEHYMSLLFDEWGKDLEKRTNGRVKVINFHAATLAPAAQTYDAVAKGIADLANVLPGNTTGRFPLSEVLELPVGFPNSVTGSKIMNEFYHKFQPKEWNKVKILWWHSQGPGFVCMKNKPIYKLEDLKGIKTRTPSGNIPFYKALGGAPVSMPMPEVYEALSKGIVDGITGAYEALESRRTGEFIKYVTENRLTSYTSSFVLAMNKRRWDSLPADIQQIIDQMSKEYIEKSGIAWDRADQSGWKFVEKRGAKKIILSKEEEQRWIEKGQKPAFEDYIKRMKAKGLPGEEALKFVMSLLNR